MNGMKLVFHDEAEFVLEGEEIFIGREPTNHLTIPAPQLSRHHARIDLVDGVWMLDDMGSTLGTTVNGEPVRSPRKLEHGDLIVFGRTVELKVIETDGDHDIEDG
ncbi:MAG: FHA domain-containing protein [Chloroflexi bacterium]|nr:FHA domain-containing protein [Chloroflexota bacterium]